VTNEWHRSEPREIRPFFAAAKAEAALELSGIRLCEGGDTTQDTTLTIEEGDLKALMPVVLPAVVNPQLWMPADLSPADVHLVLLARQPLLKRSEVLGRYPLDSSIPDELEVPPETLAAMGGGRNTQITLALALADDRVPQPGSPFVVGHWLARKTFNLRASSNPVLFDIRTRDDEDWIKHDYPAKTLYAVDYQGGMEAPSDDSSGSVAIVYVHAEAHTKMVDTKLGDALQPLLASEIITTILQMSLTDWENLAEPSSGSALESVLKQIQKAVPMSLPDLASLTRSQPNLLRAHLQSRLAVLQSLK
jgi:hypothetical protein